MGRGKFHCLDSTERMMLFWVDCSWAAWTACGESKLGHWATQKGRKKGDGWAVSVGPRGKEKKKAGPAEVLAQKHSKALLNFKTFIVYKYN
jgi:hypothetical protein